MLQRGELEQQSGTLLSNVSYSDKYQMWSREVLLPLIVLAIYMQMFNSVTIRVMYH